MTVLPLVLRGGPEAERPDPRRGLAAPCPGRPGSLRGLRAGLGRAARRCTRVTSLLPHFLPVNAYSDLLSPFRRAFPSVHLGSESSVSHVTEVTHRQSFSPRLRCCFCRTHGFTCKIHFPPRVSGWLSGLSGGRFILAQVVVSGRVGWGAGGVWPTSPSLPLPLIT